MKQIKYAAITTVESNMESFVVPAMKVFSKNGYDVTLICNMSDKYKQEKSKDFNCYNFNIKRGLHLKNLIFSIKDLYKIFKDNKFDAIQYGTENAAFCASIAGALAGVPVRVYEHWGARYVGYKGFMRFVSKCIEWVAALCSTNIRQVSFRNMEMCINDHIYSKNKVKVLGQGGTVGVDFGVFDVNKKSDYRKTIRNKYNIDNNSFVFGFVGRIQKDKGINELITAFKNIYEENSNAYLMLVGYIDNENPILAENMEWAENCPKVIFAGQVKDVYRYMCAFDLLVHPTYREGFGMVLQEAAALKTPIITTNIIGPAEFITQDVTGLLVEPKQEKELCTAMKALMNNDSKRSELSENAYQYTCEFFERSGMVNRILEDRNNLLKGSRE